MFPKKHPFRKKERVAHTTNFPGEPQKTAPKGGKRKKGKKYSESTKRGHKSPKVPQNNPEKSSLKEPPPRVCHP